MSWLTGPIVQFFANLLQGLVRDWRNARALRDQGRSEVERGQRDADDEMRRKAAEAAARSARDPRDADERLSGHGAIRPD